MRLSPCDSYSAVTYLSILTLRPMGQCHKIGENRRSGGSVAAISAGRKSWGPTPNHVTGAVGGGIEFRAAGDVAADDDQRRAWATRPGSRSNGGFHFSREKAARADSLKRAWSPLPTAISCRIRGSSSQCNLTPYSVYTNVYS